MRRNQTILVVISILALTGFVGWFVLGPPVPRVATPCASASDEDGSGVRGAPDAIPPGRPLNHPDVRLHASRIDTANTADTADGGSTVNPPDEPPDAAVGRDLEKPVGDDALLFVPLPAKLRGTIVDGRGNPLEGVQVDTAIEDGKRNSAHAYTDESGTFVLDFEDYAYEPDEPPPFLWLNLTMDHAEQPANRQLRRLLVRVPTPRPPDQWTDVRLTIPDPARLELQLVLPAGTHTNDFDITTHPLQLRPPPGMHILDNGVAWADWVGPTTAIITPLSAGRHRVQVSHSRFETLTLDVDVAPGQFAHRSIQPRPGCRLNGRVVRYDGTPVRGVLLDLRQSGERVARASTGEDGRFTCEELNPGPCEVSSLDWNWLFLRWHVPRIGGATTLPDLVLPQRCDLELTLCNRPGSKLLATLYRLDDPAELPADAFRISQDTTVVYLPPGRYRLVIGERTAPEPCVFEIGPSGRELEIDLDDWTFSDHREDLAPRPPADTTLRGTVVGPDGTPLDGVDLAALRPIDDWDCRYRPRGLDITESGLWELIAEATTNAAGEFELAVPDGGFLVHAECCRSSGGVVVRRQWFRAGAGPVEIRLAGTGHVKLQGLPNTYSSDPIELAVRLEPDPDKPFDAVELGLANMVPGRWFVVWRDGRLYARDMVELAPGGRAERQLRTDPGPVEVVGRIVAKGCELPPDCWLMMRDANTLERVNGSPFELGDDGTFRIEVDRSRPLLLVVEGRVEPGTPTAVGPVWRFKATEVATWRTGSRVPDLVATRVGGVRVQRVLHGGPGHRAGLRPLDLVIRHDDTPIQTSADLVHARNTAFYTGRSASLTVLRDGRTVRLTIPPRALGVSIR